jgi:hypothetical protein
VSHIVSLLMYGSLEVFKVGAPTHHILLNSNMKNHPFVVLVGFFGAVPSGLLFQNLFADSSFTDLN